MKQRIKLSNVFFLLFVVFICCLLFWVSFVQSGRLAAWVEQTREAVTPRTVVEI
jgi:small neutral amino acid transporter SnatA (MarC family)